MTASVFDRFGIEPPIFQAAIGSIASPELAAAVCNAAGVRPPCLYLAFAEQLKSIFAAVRAQTRQPFGANFVLGFPFEERLALALDHGIPVISFFWGDASDHLPRVKASGAMAMQVIGSVDEAKRAADAGFDVVVAHPIYRDLVFAASGDDAL